MYSVLETEQFSAWLMGLKDRTTRARLQLRLRKAMLGNLGDHKSVGGQVWELRENFGPGWRLYYTLRGTTLIVVLAGGDKASQARDIERAKAMVLELPDGQSQDPPV